VKAAQEPADRRFTQSLGRSGKTAAVEQVRRAFSNHDDGELGRLLGYPSCWPAVVRVMARGRMVRLALGACRRGCRLRGRSPARGCFALVQLLADGAGLADVPHIPCNLSCGSTAQIAEMSPRSLAGTGLIENMNG